jgi:hypothetical protein
MARSWGVGLLPILVAGAFVLGTTTVCAHGGVDDGDDGEPGEGGGGRSQARPRKNLVRGITTSSTSSWPLGAPGCKTGR